MDSLDIGTASDHAYRGCRLYPPTTLSCIKSPSPTSLESPQGPPPPSPPRRRSSLPRRHITKQPAMRTILGLTTALLVTQSCAVQIPFENCLGSDYIYSRVSDVHLQWVPQFVDARFNIEDAAHNLLVTVWGNVTGRTNEALPPPGSPLWDDNKYTNGKIVNEPEPAGPDNIRFATTLVSKVNVLTYAQYLNRDFFCKQIMNNTCPVGPVFNKTALYVPSNWLARGTSTNF